MEAWAAFNHRRPSGRGKENVVPPTMLAKMHNAAPPPMQPQRPTTAPMQPMQIHGDNQNFTNEGNQDCYWKAFDAVAAEVLPAPSKPLSEASSTHNWPKVFRSGISKDLLKYPCDLY